MTGPLSVSNLYGPVTVSVPSTSSEAQFALTVQGAEAVGDLVASGDVVADTVQAVSGLYVDGYDASPVALADVWSAVSQSVVTVIFPTVPLYAQQGFVVANPNPAGTPAYIVVTSAQLFVPGLTSIPSAVYATYGQTVTLVYANGVLSVSGTVVGLCAPANVALVAFNTPPTFAAGAVPALTSFDLNEDTPAVGTPAFVTKVSPVTG